MRPPPLTGRNVMLVSHMRSALKVALLGCGMVASLSFVSGDGSEASTVSTTQAAPTAQQIDSAPIVAQATRKPVTGKPKLPATPPSPRLQPSATSSSAPTVSELATLYARVGRELSNASKRDSTATIDLWPRYRWIRFMDAVKSPAKREATVAILQRLQADLKALEDP